MALVKINVDENPQASAAFRVQGIPAVYALRDGKVVDGFVGAQGEPQVRAFIDRLLPSEAEVELAQLLAAGDEASLRQALELDPGNEAVIVALGDQLVDDGRTEEALALLERIPETAATRHVAARARAGAVADSADDVGRAWTRCWSRSRATTRPASSSSTCSSCSAPTIPAPPTTAASSPPVCSEPGDPAAFGG